MQNRLAPAWIDVAVPGSAVRAPRLRLTVIGAVPLAIFAMILWRLALLQGPAQALFLAEFQRTTSVLEPIPSRTGRILAADGTVLAADEVTYQLAAHYRWIESPPDPDWLRQQARARLTPEERRQGDRVAAEIVRLTDEHRAAWERVADVTGESRAELQEVRRRIQRQVESMRASVLERRERPSDADATPAAASGTGQRGLASLPARLWQAVVRTLTTPPRREAAEPLVLVEETTEHLVLTEISREAAAEVEANPDRYPGMRVRSAARRIYPQGGLAPHLIGYRVPVPSADAGAHDPHETVGKTGLERQYDRELRGEPGQRRLVRNRRGDVIETETLRNVRHGRDLTLFVRAPLQRAAERLLDEALAGSAPDPEAAAPAQPPQGGCIIVLDVHTGAVLAIASAPRFDLGQMPRPRQEDWQEWLNDPRRPLFSRPTQMAIAPGSVFKVATALALLHAGLDPARPIDCEGFLRTPDKHRCLIFTQFGVGHGETDLRTALCRSCNVYFFRAAEQAGAAPLYDWSRALGFGSPTGIDLPGERAGNLPVPPQRAGNRRTRWYPGDTLGLAIGQSSLTVTPLQIVRLLAVVANGGKLVTPRVVQPRHEEPAASPQGEPIAGLDAALLAPVRAGLERVVSHPQGTGYRAVRLARIPIAGKTGTAEAAGKPSHAWFAGYVPADRPRYAFVVVLEHGGSGGRAAGPIARRLVEAMLDQGVLRERDSISGAADVPLAD